MHTARRMALSWQGGTTANDIQVDECLSKINHRLYRQGYHYRAKLELDTNSNVRYDVYALAPTWWICNAYKYARKKYNESIRKEAKALGRRMKGKWADFRVDSGTNDPSARPALYGPGGYVTFTAGQHEQSLLGLSNGNSKKFTWGAASTGFWSILEEFDATYNVQTSPSSIVQMGTEAEQPYGEVDGDGGMNPVDFMEVQTNGDTPPYNATNLTNACWIKVGSLDASAGTTGLLSTGYFDVPFGIINVVASSSTTQDGDLMLEVQAGDYQGVKAVKC